MSSLKNEKKTVLITGSDGFIGRNLRLHLSERPDIKVVEFTSQDNLESVAKLIEKIDFVFHLAGVNRTINDVDFFTHNVEFTHKLCCSIKEHANYKKAPIPFLFASSIQAELSNTYGRSKLKAEAEIKFFGAKSVIRPIIFRLPNLFGKWGRPNYNSVIATFCHNVANGLAVQIKEPTHLLTLCYIDDVIKSFVSVLDDKKPEYCEQGFATVKPEYKATVSEVASLIKSFHDDRKTLFTKEVGNGFLRALYSTYVSYLPKKSFSYRLPTHDDNRGTFVEMLKTEHNGQFSIFTAYPGITRGGHYHQTKTEKFFVIEGQALFRFRNMDTGEKHEIRADSGTPQIVETIPGWTHDVTNTGEKKLIIALWSNEVFDKSQPDTIDCPLDQYWEITKCQPEN